MEKSDTMEPFAKLLDAVQRGSLEEIRHLAVKHPELIKATDVSGATALHHAAFAGRREIAELLVELGAGVNARDGRFMATPAGWAIEYLREKGGFLGIELEDFAFAIRRGDTAWVERFLQRFPRLREASDRDGKTFRLLAAETQNQEIARLFDGDAPGR